jgi:hypothetical protein
MSRVTEGTFVSRTETYNALICFLALPLEDFSIFQVPLNDLVLAFLFEQDRPVGSSWSSWQIDQYQDNQGLKDMMISQRRHRAVAVLLWIAMGPERVVAAMLLDFPRPSSPMPFLVPVREEISVLLFVILYQ